MWSSDCTVLDFRFHYRLNSQYELLLDRGGWTLPTLHIHRPRPRPPHFYHNGIDNPALHFKLEP